VNRLFELAPLFTVTDTAYDGGIGMFGNLMTAMTLCAARNARETALSQMIVKPGHEYFEGV